MRLLRSQKGDTLVEVIFAIIILTTILVAAFSLGRQTRVQSANADVRTQAANLMQEQYEALRSFRDQMEGVTCSTGTGWSCFVGQPNKVTDGMAEGVERREDPSTTAVPLCHPVNTCFHMERQSNPGLASYGQWVPCPGQWFPPIDYDSTWNTTPGSPDSYYNTFWNTYGCQGNVRTRGEQTIVQVGISLVPYTGAGSAAFTGCNYYSVAISANWPTAGENANVNTSSFMFSDIGNVKGDPVSGGLKCQ